MSKPIIINVLLVTTLSIIVFLSGCSNSVKTNTNSAKNSNEQNTNAGVNSTTPNTNTARIPDEPAIVISAADIAKEFDKDNFAADKKLGKKKLEISGVVEIVMPAKGAGELSSVYLRGYKKHMVICFVPQSETARLVQLKRGASVTFIGTESETSIGIQMNDQVGKQIGNPEFGVWNVEITDCIFK